MVARCSSPKVQPKGSSTPNETVLALVLSGCRLYLFEFSGSAAYIMDLRKVQGTLMSVRVRVQTVRDTVRDAVREPRHRPQHATSPALAPTPAAPSLVLRPRHVEASGILRGVVGRAAPDVIPARLRVRRYLVPERVEVAVSHLVLPT